MGDKIHHINKIREHTSIEKIVSEIKLIYKQYDGEDYLPAIIQEGHFTVDEGEDLYVKLIIKHQGIQINQTWLKDNMFLGLEEPEGYDSSGLAVSIEPFIQNVITFRNYKSLQLYQLNPLIFSEQIVEYEYDNNIFVNAFYNDEYSKLKGMPVLKTSTLGAKIEVLKKVFENIINDPGNNIYPKYELLAEFEYRSHYHSHMDVKDRIVEIDEGCIQFDQSKNKTYIRGSIQLPFSILQTKHKSRNIKVIDLHSLEERNHNSRHYNGDTVAGFVCFDFKAINTLKKHFFFYDLVMYDKYELNNSYLVDVLDDKIVFWEGEYNKLPKKIKDKIDKYNFIPNNKKNIISEAMYAMQLEGDWNWINKLPPHQMLASKVKELYFNKAIDVGISFIKPKTVYELKQFINKLEKVINISPENFNTNSSDVIKLINISRDNNSVIHNDLTLLFMKYCYAVNKELENERNK